MAREKDKTVSFTTTDNVLACYVAALMCAASDMMFYRVEHWKAEADEATTLDIVESLLTIGEQFALALLDQNPSTDAAAPAGGKEG